MRNSRGTPPDPRVRTDRGWVRAGLAVLVAGVLGGGVLAAACGADDPHRVTSEGVAAGSPAAAGKPLDLAGTPKGEAAVAP